MTGRRGSTTHLREAVLVLAVAGLVLPLGAALATAATPETSRPTPIGTGDAAALLQDAATALRHPHVGRVSVVTFSDAGPRVADLDVRVDAMGHTELRGPTRWLVGGGSSSWLRTSDGAVGVAPSALGARLDVAVVLERWEAHVGPPRTLDTGPATPVHLVRRSGSAIEEVLYLDHATSLPVRRETRTADGDVLRVVAYLDVATVEMGVPAALSVPAADGDRELAAADGRRTDVLEDGYDVPEALPAGFTLLGTDHHDDMAVARYGDGLSVLSVYQQHGRLDPADLDGATVRMDGDRHLWTWPGAEPTRVVWTGGDRTWTVVSDAPLPVIEEALAALPGDRVGHDVGARILRGLERVGGWLRGLLTG